MESVKINLSELKQYSRQLIAEWLAKHNTGTYIVQIHWEFNHSNDELLNLFSNYTNAAYAGELLAQCSKIFQSTSPLPGQGPFQFIVTPTSKKDLAKKLSIIMGGYYTQGEKMLHFSNCSHQYFLDVLEGKVETPVPSLIAFAKRLFSSMKSVNAHCEV